MKRTTIKEYDSEGKLLKETVIEEDTPVNTVPIVYPAYPIYPNQPLVTYYLDTTKITCESSQKGL